MVRDYLKAQRGRLTYKKRQEKSLKIMENLLTLLEGKENIALYINTNDEVNTLDFIPYFLQNFKTVSASITDETMQFYKIENVKRLTPGFKGILEPLPNTLIEKEDIEVMIIPMLGYDKHCNRMGYGAGFYDRYLEEFKGIKIGLAFAEQQYPLLPTNQYDVKMDYVITDREIIKQPKF